VGGGNLLDSIRDAIVAEGLQQRVLFADEVSQEKMKHYFASADIFVYASKEDFRATVVTEAMYLGLPVVAVRSGGTQERVMDKVTGLLVPEQEEMFMNAVKRLLEDPKKSDAFGRSGKLFAEEHYTNPKSVDALIGVYERAMKNEE
jgi:glycosyltransferase involved in cell wall biosynthesis